MTIEKPRKWWLDLCRHPDDEHDFYAGDALLKHPGQGPLQWQASLVHVIEKSHADLLERKLKRAMDGLKDAGKTICGEFCGSTKCHPCCNEVTNALKEIEEMK